MRKQQPNAETQAAMQDARTGRVTKAVDLADLLALFDTPDHPPDTVREDDALGLDPDAVPQEPPPGWLPAGGSALAGERRITEG